MKLHTFAIAILLATCAPSLPARILELSGIFENSVTVDPSFPPGAAYTLTIDYDENAEDLNASIANADSFLYQPLRSYTLSVPSTGGMRTSSSVLGNLEIERSPRFGDNAAKLNISDFSGENLLTIDLEWTVNSPAKAGLFASRDLASADLTPAASDFIWLRFRGFPNVFAFSAIHSRTATGTPAAFRESGFDEIFVFGDSLSGITARTTDNPLYFERGYTNGPNWVQHLAQGLRIPFRPGNVVARFGGITPYNPADLATTPTDRSLLTWWDNSENFRAFLNASLFGNVAFESIVLESEERLQLALLGIINQADALGIKNALLLVPVDFGFAPSAQRSFDTPEKRQSLTDLITAINASLRTRAAETARLYPSVAQRLLDPADYLLDVLADPSGFGLTEVDTAVISPGEAGQPPVIIADPSLDGPGADHFFWGGSAPTSCVHRILSEYVIRDAFPAFRQGAEIELIAVRPDLVRIQTSRLTAGRTYVVQQSSDLFQWDDVVPGPFTAAGPARKITRDNFPRDKEFFRIISVME